jgi:hypothetical protein
MCPMSKYVSSWHKCCTVAVYGIIRRQRMVDIAFMSTDLQVILSTSADFMKRQSFKLVSVSVCVSQVIFSHAVLQSTFLCISCFPPMNNTLSLPFHNP